MSNKKNPIRSPQLNEIAYQKIKGSIVTLKLALSRMPGWRSMATRH